MEEDQRVDKKSWLALIILMFIYACHAVDRSVMAIVAEPVKREFLLTDSQLGLLTGLGYALTYALAGIPVGYLVDRVKRRNLLASLVTIWSGFTILCGFATSYGQLLGARMLVGAAEAGGAPTALSMISDIFPEHRRAGAISIFWMSTALGTALSMMLGGYVASHYGWRMAFFIAGVPGLVFAILLLILVKEPPRKSVTNILSGEDDVADVPPKLLTTFKHFIGQPALLHCFAAIVLNSCVLSAMLVWAVSYFMRLHDMSVVTAGLMVGIGVALFGGLGSLLGGVASDFSYKRWGGLRFTPMVALVPSILTMFIVAAFAFTRSFYVAAGLFAIFELVSRMHVAPGYAFLLGNLHARMRGVVLSSLQLGTNLIGFGLGVALVGFVSDQVGGPNSLRFGIAALVLLSGWASFHFLMAYRAVGAAEDASSRQQAASL